MRKTINATEGHILTNGEVYGRTIYLAEGVDESAFFGIDESELEELQAEAEIEDYKEALARFGVTI
jgi:hypothetical protein